MLNKLILFALSLFFLPACFNFGGGLSVRYNYPSVGEGSAPSDSAYLYIDLDTNQYKADGDLVPYYEISTTTEFGDAEQRNSLSNCEIYYNSPDEEDDIGEKSASEDNLICILDLMEYDFMVNEIHMIYNFPEGMCDYIRWSLPWHFNHEILPGPVVVQKTTEVPADPLPQICSQNPNDDSCTVEKTTLCDTSVTPENCQDTSDNFSEEDFCPASDGSDENPVRCCSGGSKVDGTEWEPDLGCFGGPSLIAEVEGANKEFHEAVLEELPEGGLKRRVTLPDLISINGAEQKGNAETGFTAVSSPFANYLKALDKSSEKLTQVKRSVLPDFLKASDYYNHWPEPFFEFECLDRAGEILHKILLMIREWNTYEEFIDFYNQGGNDSADPDVEGEEGDECKYEDRKVLDGEVEACNDLLDLDDIVDCEDYAWCSTFSQTSKIPGSSQTVIYPRINYTGGGE